MLAGWFNHLEMYTSSPSVKLFKSVFILAANSDLVFSFNPILVIRNLLVRD